MPRARVCNSPGGGRHYHYYYYYYDGEWPPCNDGHHRHVLSRHGDYVPPGGRAGKLQL